MSALEEKQGMIAYKAAFALSAWHNTNIIVVLLLCTGTLHAFCSDCTLVFPTFLFKHTIKMHDSVYGHSSPGVLFKIIKSIWKSCHYLTTFKEFPDGSVRRRKGEPGRHSINTPPNSAQKYGAFHLPFSRTWLHIRFRNSLNIYSQCLLLFPTELLFNLVLAESYLHDFLPGACFLPFKHYPSFS